MMCFTNNLYLYISWISFLAILDFLITWDTRSRIFRSVVDLQYSFFTPCHCTLYKHNHSWDISTTYFFTKNQENPFNLFWISCYCRIPKREMIPWELPCFYVGSLMIFSLSVNISTYDRLTGEVKIFSTLYIHFDHRLCYEINHLKKLKCIASYL